MRNINTGNRPRNVSIRNQLKPGDIGYIVYLHGIIYAQEYGWDYTFETYVAGPLAEFAKAPGERGRIWIVEKDEQVAGSVAIVEVSEREAQLRWMLLTADLRGYGLGRHLVEQDAGFLQGARIYHGVLVDGEHPDPGGQTVPIGRFSID